MTRQQQWAKAALARVDAVKGDGDEAKFKTLCMTTPALLQQSGLVQGLAFLWARDKDLGKRFVGDLAAVYRGGKAEGSGRKLLDDAQGEEDLRKYMAMTADLIDVAIWFRRFAQAELKGEVTEDRE